MTIVSDEYCRIRAQLDALLGNQDVQVQAQAATLAKDAVSWCRRHLPAGHPELVAALVKHAWASFYVSQCAGPGTYDLAQFEPLFEEALRIQRSRSGRKSQPVAQTLTGLIACLLFSRRWAEAITQLEELIEVQRELRGPRSTEVAIAERQMGDAAHWLQQPETAEIHYRRSLAIWKDNPLHWEAATAWKNWGYLCEHTGRVRQARASYKRAGVVIAAVWGQACLPYAQSLLPLSRANVKLGALAVGIRLLVSALAIQRAYLGDSHPDVGASWADLSVLAAAYGSASARQVSRSALQADIAWLGSAVRGGYQEAANIKVMLATLITRADRHLDLLLDGEPDGDLATEAAWVAGWRKRLPDLLLPYPWLASSADLADLARQRREIMGEIATERQTHTTFTNAGSPEDWVAVQQQAFLAWVGSATRMGGLVQRRREVEKALHRHALGKLPEYGLLATQPSALQNVLIPGECFIEIVRLSGRNGERYRALVIGSRREHITAVDLGPAQDIDALVISARAGLEGPERAGAFLATGQSGPAPDRRQTAGELASRIFGPLGPHISGHEHLIFVLDGPLLHVPLGTLPAGDGQQPLLARSLVSYVNGMDDLTRIRSAGSGAGPGPDMIIAAPDFDLGSTGPATKRLFHDLSGAMAEGEGVASALSGAMLYMGDQALKARLQAARSPRILHLATHGYNFADLARGDLDEMARMVEPAHRWSTRFAVLRQDRELHSGLALAGANTWLRHGNPGAEADTALLTVADIAGLDLAGTDLVVLSACDTGVSGITDPEGPASLRAAFMRAGARTVIASLWKVPDPSTRRLMIRFYNLLGTGLGKGEALRQAQLESYLAGAPPLLWGAFVCYGDTGPLRPLASG